MSSRRWGFTSASKHPVPTVPSKIGSGDNSIPKLDAASSLSAPNVPNDPRSLDLTESTTSDGDVIGGVTSSDGRPSIHENDIVIAVMGPTGAGKSSFVNKVAGGEEAAAGHDLRSKTRALKAVRCVHPDGRSVVLVDTPGFDDTYLSDTQILRIIANWLKSTYQKNIKLSGLLYFHRISDVRMAGTPLRNLAVFQDLCGTDNLKNVVLVTTMWDEVGDQSAGSKREEELLSNFWKSMIDLGSRSRRYEGTHASAWEIIEFLDPDNARQRRTPLQIQREMVDRQLPLHETAAAKTLFGYLVQLVGDFKKVWTKMRIGKRRKPEPKSQVGGLRRNALSRSSTLRSESSFSVVSSEDAVSSSGSETDPSPTSTVSTGCSATGGQDALIATITGLRISHQVADIAGIPMLRGAIGTVLQIAQLIHGMGGTHHATTQVVENSGWLLGEITEYAAKTALSRDMKRTLRSFRRELTSLQKVVAKVMERGPIARFFLHEADIHALTKCTVSIKDIYDKLEVKLAMDNRHAIARLEEQLTALCNSTALRQCQCHRILVPHEESESPEN